MQKNTRGWGSPSVEGILDGFCGMVCGMRPIVVRDGSSWGLDLRSSEHRPFEAQDKQKCLCYLEKI